MNISFRISTLKENVGLSDQNMKKQSNECSNLPLEKKVHISTEPPTPTKIRNNSRDYFKNFNEEYQAKASTGVRVKVMNFQKKHENLLYPLGCYYYCPKSH